MVSHWQKIKRITRNRYNPYFVQISPGRKDRILLEFSPVLPVSSSKNNFSWHTVFVIMRQKPWSPWFSRAPGLRAAALRKRLYWQSKLLRPGFTFPTVPLQKCRDSSWSRDPKFSPTFLHSECPFPKWDLLLSSLYEWPLSQYQLRADNQYVV